VLCRRFGREGAEKRIRELRCVWISHIHADHHVGLPLLLAERARLVGPTAPWIPLFGPFPLRKALSACNRITPLRFRWIDQYHLTPREQGAGRDLDYFWDRLTDNDGVSDVVDAVKVAPPNQCDLNSKVKQTLVGCFHPEDLYFKVNEYM
jgi:hypothetical protein